MGKNQQQLVLEGQQLVLEEYQETRPEIIRIDIVSAPDQDMDIGSLPGCIGFHNQPEQGYVCSSCYHQQLCRTTTPTTTIIVNKR